MLGLAIGIVLLGAGGYLVWRGIRTYRYVRRISGAVPYSTASEAGTVSVADGRVTRSESDVKLKSQFSATPCIAYASKRVKEKAQGKEDIRRSNSVRERVRESTDVIPFQLDTEDGPIVVKAGTARVEVDPDQYERVSLSDVRQNRGGLMGFLWLLRSVATALDRQVRRTYLEAVIQVGDAVCVIGTLDRTGSKLIDSETVPLIVTSTTQDDVVAQYSSSAKQRFFSGGILFVVGVGLVLAIVGVI